MAVWTEALEGRRDIPWHRRWTSVFGPRFAFVKSECSYLMVWLEGNGIIRAKNTCTGMCLALSDCEFFSI